MCQAVSSSEGLGLSVTWNHPSLSTDSVVLYELTVEQYEQPGDASTLTIVDLPTPFKQTIPAEGSLEATVTTGVRECGTYK